MRSIKHSIEIDASHTEKNHFHIFIHKLWIGLFTNTNMLKTQTYIALQKEGNRENDVKCDHLFHFFWDAGIVIERSEWKSVGGGG